MVNVGSTSVGARVAGIKPEVAKLELTGPVCTRVSIFKGLLALIRLYYGSLGLRLSVTAFIRPHRLQNDAFRSFLGFSRV